MYQHITRILKPVSVGTFINILKAYGEQFINFQIDDEDIPEAMYINFYNDTDSLVINMSYKCDAVQETHTHISLGYAERFNFSVNDIINFLKVYNKKDTILFKINDNASIASLYQEDRELIMHFQTKEENKMEVKVIGNVEVSEEEQKAYVDYVQNKFGKRVKSLTIKVDGDYVDLGYELEAVPFERIRRITGYLVGTMEKWNDAKSAEERDRVKHGTDMEEL